jgi:uracil-DNA glycosylase
MKKARDRAQELQKERRLFVLLGAKVCDAFGVPFEPFTIQVKTTSAAVAILLKVPHQEWTFVVLPHPSGRNRLWNDPLAVDKARKVLKEAGVL